MTTRDEEAWAALAAEYAESDGFFIPADQLKLGPLTDEEIEELESDVWDEEDYRE